MTRAFFRTTGKAIGGRSIIGGLIGENDGSVSQSFTDAEVGGPDTYLVGGLIGIHRSGAVSDSYTLGTVAGSGVQIGAVIGEAHEGTVTNTYTPSTAYKIIGSRKTDIVIVSSYHQHHKDRFPSNGTWVTDERMKQQATFAGWDFDNVWDIDEGASYPVLRWLDTE